MIHANKHKGASPSGAMQSHERPHTHIHTHDKEGNKTL